MPRRFFQSSLINMFHIVLSSRPLQPFQSCQSLLIQFVHVAAGWVYVWSKISRGEERQEDTYSLFSGIRTKFIPILLTTKRRHGGSNIISLHQHSFCCLLKMDLQKERRTNLFHDVPTLNKEHN